MSKETPYVGFSNETWRQCDEGRPGQEIKCPECGAMHPLEDSKPSGLLFYKCGEKVMLAGIDGKLVIGVKSDASGKIPHD